MAKEEKQTSAITEKLPNEAKDELTTSRWLIQSSQASMWIGSEGNAINRICKECKVDIQITPTASKKVFHNIVLIKGSPMAISNALRNVAAVLRPLQDGQNKVVTLLIHFGLLDKLQPYLKTISDGWRTAIVPGLRLFASSEVPLDLCGTSCDIPGCVYSILKKLHEIPPLAMTKIEYDPIKATQMESSDNPPAHQSTTSGTSTTVVPYSSYCLGSSSAYANPRSVPETAVVPYAQPCYTCWDSAPFPGLSAPYYGYSHPYARPYAPAYAHL